VIASEPKPSTPARSLVGGALLGLLLGLVSLGFAWPADAKTRAECERDYTPQRGQEGKDVMWAPTEDGVLVRMLEMAKVTAADTVYDLGAGDGKIVIAAAKRFGATGVGVEYDAALAKHAQCLAEAEGVEDRVTIIQGDIFATDFSAATVVTLYLLPELNVRLRPQLLSMKPGTRVVSYSFTMGEWEPDDHVDTAEGSAYLWIVPARADGTWTFRANGGEDVFAVTLTQAFQNLRGVSGGTAVTGKLDGARLDLTFVRDALPTRVTGIVAGNRIAATVTRDGRAADYVGTRE
jgi:SAM-dependent methyltransferase